MDTNLIAKSLSFHGQPLQKIWEGERGNHDLYRLGITNPDYSVYTVRQKNLTFQDRAKRLKLHQFIAKKATILFDNKLVTDDHGIKNKKEKSVANTVIMPPFESFISKAIDKNRHLHKILEIIQPGDIVYCQIIQRNSSGLLVKVLCTGEPLYRYLADFTIKAYVLSQNMIPALDKRGNQKPYLNNDYVCCEVLEISADADRMNLGMKGTLTIDEKAPLGSITAEQMPEYYKRTIQNQDISYTDLLENSENFFNPESEDILLQEIGIQSPSNSIIFSNMNSLKCDFPQQEYANELRQTQASKWAFRSVADGIEHFKVGRHTEAFQCLNKALNIDPRNVEGLVARGALYANSGSFKKAVTDFETALKLNPYHANARKYMGETLVALGRSYEEENRIDDARKAYKDCLIIIPHHEEAKSSLEFLNGKAAANQINKQLIDANELLLPGFKSSKNSSITESTTMKDTKKNNSTSSDGANKKDKLSKKKKKKDKNRHRHHRNHHKRKNVSSSSSDSDNDDDDDDTSDDTGSSTTSRSDTDGSTDDSSSTTADSRSSSRSATNASSSKQKSKGGGGRSNKNDNDNNKYNKQKSLSPLSKRMAIMDEQNSSSTSATARYHFNQPFHLANTPATISGMSAMTAMGGIISGGNGGGGGGGSGMPSSQQIIGGTSASRITSADTNLIRQQQDYQQHQHSSASSSAAAAAVDSADDYDTKVRNFLEMTRDEDDYESRVRSLVEEVSKYRKERKTSTGIGGIVDRPAGDDSGGGGGGVSSGKKKKDKKKQKKLKKEQKKSKKKKDKEKKSSSSHHHGGGGGGGSSNIDIDNMELKEAIEIVKSIPMLDFETKLTADLQKYEKSIDISHRNPSVSKVTTSEYFRQDSESSNSDDNEIHQKIGDERKKIRESIASSSAIKRFSSPSSRFSRNNLHLNESSYAATISQAMMSSSSSTATKAPIVLDKFGCFRLAAPDEKVDLPMMMTNTGSAVAATTAGTISTIKRRSSSPSPHRHYSSRSRSRSRSSRSRSRYRRGSSRSPRRSRSLRRSRSPQRHSRSRSRRKSRSVRRSLRNSPRRSSPPSRWSPRRRSPRRRSRSMRRSRTPPHGKSFSRRSISRTGGGGGRISRSRSRSRSMHRRSRSPVNRRSRSIEFSGGRRRRSFSRSVSYNRSRSRSPWRRGRGRGGGGFRGNRGHFSYRGRGRGRGGGFRGGRRSPFFRNRNYSPDRSPPPPSSVRDVHRRDDENLNRPATKINKLINKGRKDGIDGKWTHDKYEKSGSAESDKLQETGNQSEENWDEDDIGTDAGGNGSVTVTDIATSTTTTADPNEPSVEEIDKIINKAQKERKEEILQRDKDLLKKPTPTNLPF